MKKPTVILLHAFKWLGITLAALLILLFILVCSILFTQTGRSTVINNGLDFVNNNTPWQINKEILTMPSLSKINISNLVVLYEEKPVIEIKGGFVQWQPSQLFKKNITVNAIKLNGITAHLNNMPASQTEPSNKNKQPFTLSDLDSIKQKLPDTLIENINITHVNINAGSSNNSNNNTNTTINPEQNPVLPPIFTQYTYHVLGQLILKKSQPIQSQLELRTQPRKKNITTHNTETVLNIIQTDTHTLKVSLNISETEPGFFTRILKIQDAQDTPFTANLNAIVTLENMLNIQLSSLSLPVSNTQLNASGTVISDLVSQVTLNNILINISEKTHTLNGELTKEKAQLNANIQAFDLTLLQPWLPDLKQGKVSASLEVKGAWDALNFSTQANGSVIYLNLPASFNANIQGSQNIITVNQFALKSQKANVNVKGNVNVKKQTINTQFDARTIALAPFKPVIKQFVPNNTAIDDLIFNLNNAQGTLTGTFSHPKIDVKAQAEGQFKQESFNLNVASLADKKRIQLSEFIFSVAQSKTVLSGDINLEKKSLEADINVTNLPFMLASLAGMDLPPNLTGKINTNLEIAGAFSQPNVQGGARISGQFDAVPFVYEQDIHYNNAILTIKQATLDVFDEKVMDMSVSFDGAEIDTTIKMSNLPTKLINLLPVTLNEGDLYADITVKGPLLLPNIDATLRYDSFVLVQNNNEADTKTPYTLALDVHTNEKSVLTLDIKANIENNDPAVLSVVAPLNPIKEHFTVKDNSAPLPLDVSIEGLLNLQTAQLFLGSNVHEFKGEIALDANVSGNVTGPSVTGSINLDKAAYAHAVHGTQLNNIRCALNLKPQSASVNHCQARDGDKGNVSINGDITYPFTRSSENGDIRLAVNLDNMRLVDRKEITSQTSGEITIDGDIKTLDITGDLNITPLSASIESAPPVSIPSIEVTEVTSFDVLETQQDKKGSLAPTINLDIDINATNQAFLRGRGLDAELAGGIKVYGTAQEPQYDGEFTIARGHIELFNKKFDLTGGKVTLATQAVGLNIVGSYSEDSQRINVILSGRADDVQIDFTAEPTLPEDEILAFIIFGKNITEISSLEALQLASAVRQLQGGGGFDVIASTRDTLGVDNLSFESGDEGVNIGVGKYINERVYLEVQKTPDPSQPWQGNITIDLLPNLKLESSTGGTSGVPGAALKWKNDY